MSMWLHCSNVTGLFVSVVPYLPATEVLNVFAHFCFLPGRGSLVCSLTLTPVFLSLCLGVCYC